MWSTDSKYRLSSSVGSYSGSSSLALNAQRSGLGLGFKASSNEVDDVSLPSSFDNHSNLSASFVVVSLSIVNECGWIYLSHDGKAYYCYKYLETRLSFSYEYDYISQNQHMANTHAIKTVNFKYLVHSFASFIFPLLMHITLVSKHQMLCSISCLIQRRLKRINLW